MKKRLATVPLSEHQYVRTFVAVKPVKINNGKEFFVVKADGDKKDLSKFEKVNL